GRRLAEELTPDVAVLGERWQQGALHLFAAPLHDRGPAHAHADHVEAARHLVAVQLRHDLADTVGAEPSTAVLLRPARRGVPRFAEAAAPVVVVDLLAGLGHQGRIVVLDALDPLGGEVLVQPADDFFSDAHGRGPYLTDRSSSPARLVRMTEFDTDTALEA